jgi:hypothetical protein
MLTPTLPTPTHPDISVRAINTRLAVVVEAKRPNCRLGYLGRTSTGGWLLQPATLAAYFVRPVEPAVNQNPVFSTTIKACNEWGDVDCGQCGNTHPYAARFRPKKVDCSCGHSFTALPWE